jgi:hypothetical protein
LLRLFREAVQFVARTTCLLSSSRSTMKRLQTNREWQAPALWALTAAIVLASLAPFGLRASPSLCQEPSYRSIRWINASIESASSDVPLRTVRPFGVTAQNSVRAKKAKPPFPSTAAANGGCEAASLSGSIVADRSSIADSQLAISSFRGRAPPATT